MSANVLDSHPDLLPEIVKLLSTALTTAQETARTLEQKLQQQDYALLEAETNVETLTKKYEREREGGDELRAALEQRFTELRTRETQVEESRRLLEARMQGLTDGAEAHSIASTGGSQTSTAVPEARTCDECEALRKTLASSTQTLRAKDEALSALAAANRDLGTALCEAEQLGHARFVEVKRLTAALEIADTKIYEVAEQIEARDAVVASLREALGSSKLDVSSRESSLSTLASTKQDIQKSLKSAEMQIIDLTERKLEKAEMQRATSHAGEVRVKSEVEDVRELADSGAVVPQEELQRLTEKNQELIKGLQEAFGINEAAVKENVGFYAKLQTQQNRIDELLKSIAALQAETETQKADAVLRNSALRQLGEMYSEREIECGELKEALQQREHITVQQTPPPTPPPKPQVAAVPPPPPKPQATLVAQKKKTERSRYTAYMNALPTLPLLDRPTFDNTESALQPVAKLTHSSFTDLLRHRKMVHCPKRTIWCDATKTNALVIAPTHVISRSENRCVENQAMTRYCGQHVEFFAHKGHFVYYFGTYVVHSLRAVNPPGGEIPSDVSNNAIYAEMGLTEADVRNSSQFLPGGRVGTECFGMQCVGFDLELYRALKDRYRSEATTSEVALKNAEPRKRKAEVELRDENQVKAPRLA